MTWHEVGSEVLGWFSVACWIVFSSPQWWENYKNQSCAGLSIVFLCIWLVGDSLNLVGGILAQQLSSQIYVAVWYVISDTISILQFLYYEKIVKKGKRDEEQSLIPAKGAAGDDNSRLYTLPAVVLALFGLSLVFSLQAAAAAAGGVDAPQFAAAEYTTGRQLLWEEDGASKFDDTDSNGLRDVCAEPDDPVLYRIGKVFGWTSAAFYFSSRFPQIYKNFSRKSTSGLNIAMFILALIGNFTYAGSIFIYSTQLCFLRQKLPWLLGSLGTVSLDVFLLFQFHLYKNNMPKKADEEAGRIN